MKLRRINIFYSDEDGGYIAEAPALVTPQLPRFDAPPGKPPGWPAKPDRHEQAWEWCLAQTAIFGQPPAWADDFIPPRPPPDSEITTGFHRGMNTIHPRLALGTAIGRPGYGAALELCYRDQEPPRDHGGAGEGLSRGYAGKHWVAAAAIILGEPYTPTQRALARGYLRRRMTIDALMCTPGGRVVAPCGRYVKPRRTGIWIDLGSVNASTGYALAVTLKIEPRDLVGWGHRSSLTARIWREREGELRDRLFPPAEASALRAWVLERKIVPELRELVADVRLVQRLHVLAGAPGQHVAWMEEIGSYTGNGVQPAVLTDGGHDWFCVGGKAPAAVRWEGHALVITAAGREERAGIIRGWPNSAVEIYIGPDAVRVGGEAPAPGDHPAPPVPPDPPAGPSAEVESVLSDLRRIAGSRTAVRQARAHLIDRTDRSEVAVAMGYAFLAAKRVPLGPVDPRLSAEAEDLRAALDHIKGDGNAVQQVRAYMIDPPAGVTYSPLRRAMGEAYLAGR